MISHFGDGIEVGVLLIVRDLLGSQKFVKNSSVSVVICFWDEQHLFKGQCGICKLAQFEMVANIVFYL